MELLSAALAVMEHYHHLQMCALDVLPRGEDCRYQKDWSHPSPKETGGTTVEAMVAMSTWPQRQSQKLLGIKTFLDVIVHALLQLSISLLGITLSTPRMKSGDEVAVDSACSQLFSRCYQASRRGANRDEYMRFFRLFTNSLEQEQHDQQQVHACETADRLHLGCDDSGESKTPHLCRKTLQRLFTLPGAIDAFIRLFEDAQKDLQREQKKHQQQQKDDQGTSQIKKAKHKKKFKERARETRREAQLSKMMLQQGHRCASLSCSQQNIPIIAVNNQ